MVSKLSEIWSGLFIPDPDPDFTPIPDPGVKKAPDPGSGSATLHKSTDYSYRTVAYGTVPWGFSCPPRCGGAPRRGRPGGPPSHAASAPSACSHVTRSSPPANLSLPSSLLQWVEGVGDLFPRWLPVRPPLGQGPPPLLAAQISRLFLPGRFWGGRSSRGAAVEPRPGVSLAAAVAVQRRCCLHNIMKSIRLRFATNIPAKMVKNNQGFGSGFVLNRDLIRLVDPDP